MLCDGYNTCVLVQHGRWTEENAMMYRRLLAELHLKKLFLFSNYWNTNSLPKWLPVVKKNSEHNLFSLPSMRFRLHHRGSLSVIILLGITRVFQLSHFRPHCIHLRNYLVGKSDGKLTTFHQSLLRKNLGEDVRPVYWRFFSNYLLYFLYILHLHELSCLLRSEDFFQSLPCFTHCAKLTIHEIFDVVYAGNIEPFV